jgi:hypothetical protein
MNKVVLKILLVTLVGVLQYTAVFCQQLTYTITVKDDVIGKLIAYKNTHGSKTDYTLVSDINVHKVVDIAVFYKLEASFEKSKLMSSKLIQTTNERQNVNSTTYWNGSNYMVTVDGDKNSIKEKIIDYNLATLYYQEPINRKKIWSDAYGKFLPIRMTKKGSYELSLPDGRKNMYTYYKGICTQVITEQMLTKIIFTLTKNEK